jgi:hypothetical protein
MDVNDRLSPREHAEVRDLVLAGTQHIRPAGRRRTQAISAAIALVLVGGVTGGAIATAAILGTDGAPAPVASQPTVDPTPTRAPSAAPSPMTTPESPPPQPPAPTEGVVPFGADCANTLTDEEVDALRGLSMMRSDYRWHTGANAVLGGIDCVWVAEEEYLAATVHLYAYPESVVPERVRAAVVAGCSDLDSESPQVFCSSVGVVDGMWLLVRAAGSADQVTATGVDALYAKAAQRLGQHPSGAAATPTAEWWSDIDCEGLVAQIDPAVYGFERVALLDQHDWEGEPSYGPETISAQASSMCQLHFTSGAGDTSTGEVVHVWTVPGGAGSFTTAVHSEGAQPVTVEGSQGAVIASGLDRYEGSPSMIVTTDGVNMLMVAPDWISDPVKAAPLTAVVLAFLEG